MENRKVRGARSVTFNNIKFRSLRERTCYMKLLDSGLEFYYEPEKITLWEGIKLNKVLFYAPPSSNTKLPLEQYRRGLVSITYTPDFKIINGNYVCYFDVKGYANDRYPIKKKMFLKKLEQREDGKHYLLFELYSVKHILQAIEAIKKL